MYKLYKVYKITVNSNLTTQKGGAHKPKHSIVNPKKYDESIFAGHLGF